MKSKMKVPWTINRFLFHSLGIFLILNFIFTNAVGQTQNRAWTVGCSTVLFPGPTMVYNCNAWPYGDANSNSIQDPQGRLLFRFNNLNGGAWFPSSYFEDETGAQINDASGIPIYTNFPTDHALYGYTMGVYTTDEICIVPVPGECKKYYIIQTYLQNYTSNGTAGTGWKAPVYHVFDSSPPNLYPAYSITNCPATNPPAGH
jgi:hypothetical protein